MNGSGTPGGLPLICRFFPGFPGVAPSCDGEPSSSSPCLIDRAWRYLSHVDCYRFTSLLMCYWDYTLSLNPDFWFSEFRNQQAEFHNLGSESTTLMIDIKLMRSWTNR
jgi:hypothetical protein